MEKEISIPLSKSYTIKENQKDFPEYKNLIPVSSSFSILSNGKVSKKRLLDALACLEADLKFLQEEIKKSEEDF